MSSRKDYFAVSNKDHFYIIFKKDLLVADWKTVRDGDTVQFKYGKAVYEGVVRSELETEAKCHSIILDLKKSRPTRTDSFEPGKQRKAAVRQRENLKELISRNPPKAPTTADKKKLKREKERQQKIDKENAALLMEEDIMSKPTVSGGQDGKVDLEGCNSSTDHSSDSSASSLDMAFLKKNLSQRQKDVKALQGLHSYDSSEDESKSLSVLKCGMESSNAGQSSEKCSLSLKRGMESSSRGPSSEKQKRIEEEHPPHNVELPGDDEKEQEASLHLSSIVIGSKASKSDLIGEVEDDGNGKEEVSNNAYGPDTEDNGNFQEADMEICNEDSVQDEKGITAENGKATTKAAKKSKKKKIKSNKKEKHSKSEKQRSFLVCSSDGGDDSEGSGTENKNGRDDSKPKTGDLADGANGEKAKESKTKKIMKDKKKKAKKGKKYHRKRDVKRNLTVYHGPNFLYKKDDAGVVKLNKNFDVYVKETELNELKDAPTPSRFVRGLVEKVFTKEAILGSTPQGFPPRGKGRSSYSQDTLPPRLHPDGMNAIIGEAKRLQEDNKNWRPKTNEKQLRSAFSVRCCELKSLWGANTSSSDSDSSSDTNASSSSSDTD